MNAIEVRNRKKTVLSIDEKISILGPKTSKYIDFSINLCCKTAELDESNTTWVYMSCSLLSMTDPDIRFRSPLYKAVDYAQRIYVTGTLRLAAMN